MEGVLNTKTKGYEKILGIGIPYLLLNLMSSHGFSKNNIFIVIFKYPKRMLEYYFSKGCTIFNCNITNLEELPNEVRVIIHSKDTVNPYKFMICSTKINST